MLNNFKNQTNIITFNINFNILIKIRAIISFDYKFSNFINLKIDYH